MTDSSSFGVQICESVPRRHSEAHHVPAWKSLEAVLGRHLTHRNIVRTLTHSTVLLQASPPFPKPAAASIPLSVTDILIV